MRTSLLASIAALGIGALLLSCGQSGAAFDAALHREEVLDWRLGRLERLMAPTGYLTLAGLFWLHPGSYSFGSDPTNDVVFPGAAAAVIGELQVVEEGISMDVVEGVEVGSEGIAAGGGLGKQARIIVTPFEN